MTDTAQLEPIRRPRRPWFLSLLGIAAISGLVALPILVGEPDGSKMPDWVRFTGRFHPMMLHLPIGIFALILIQEIGSMFSRKANEQLRPRLFPLFFGAASAILAVLLGFLLYQGGGYEGSEIAERHMWAGLVFSIAAVVTLLVKAWTITTTANLAVYRSLLFLSVGVMGFASHDGASLTHGSDWLFKFAPNPVREFLGMDPKLEVAPDRPVDDLVVYQEVIVPILERTCVKCHGEEVQKSRLRLDSHEAMLKGGREGPAIEPGSAAESQMIIYMEWPEDDPDYDDLKMPPADKPQPTAEEVVILKWWLDAGALPDAKVGDLAPDEGVRTALIAHTGASAAAATAEPSADEDEKPAMESAAEKSSKVDPALVAKVEALQKNFPGAVTFESQESDNITFTAVSIRAAMDDARLAEISEIYPYLVSLDLSATKITDVGVAPLKDATRLTMIRLSETSITDAALDTLAAMPSLESINLFGTQVSTEGVLKLAPLPNLQRLYLWQTPIDEAGLTELRAAMPNVEIVTGI